MITEALRHCAGIGPARLAQLHQLGIRSWSDVLAGMHRIPRYWRGKLADECRRCLSALENEDIQYFAEQFSPQDKWRIVAHFVEQATFFDIETAGLDLDSPITVIGCWHDGRLHCFAEQENLDEFLDLLDRVRLLISFNGSAFDVPRILSAFHIPQLPCAHLDLRWACYHHGWKGGLKQIASQLGIKRPPDLDGAHGELAVQLWYDWQLSHSDSARARLIRYCAADVLMLVILAERLAGRQHASLQEYWQHLPAPPDSSQCESFGSQPPLRCQSSPRGITPPSFGPTSPARLRALRTRMVG